MSTDKDWEKWGKTNPYFGVISDERYRNCNLTEKNKEDFFASGVEHVEYVLNLINKEFGVKEFSPNSVLDFGCGVGRLVIPFSRISKHVVGLDISPSMLEIAQKNVTDKKIKNVNLAISDDNFLQDKNFYSLIHSYIVFQHIPKDRGHKIILNLARKVEPNGFLAIHIFTESKASFFVKALVRLRYLIPFIQWGWNILKKRPVFEPPMQLNCYNAEHLEKNLRELGYREIRFIKVPSIEGFTGVFLIARNS